MSWWFIFVYVEQSSIRLVHNTAQHTLSRDYKQLFLSRQSLCSFLLEYLSSAWVNIGTQAHQLPYKQTGWLAAGCASPHLSVPPYIDDVYLPYMIIYTNMQADLCNNSADEMDCLDE